MFLFLVAALLIAFLTAVFALQNAVPVTVTLFSWQVQASLALVLLCTLALGLCAGALLCLPGLLKGRWRTASLRRKMGELEREQEGAE